VSSRALWKMVGLSLCCFSSIAYAESVGVKNIRLGVRHLEPKGIGFNDGYTTFEGFFAPPVDRHSVIPFLDLRAHVFNSGRMAVNAGLGVRQLWGCRVYGVNAYYDYRTTRRHHYNQATVGLESLGTTWDFRLNGYLPFGSKQSRGYHTQFEEFSGNNAIISRKYEFAMKGVNAEAGVHFGKTTHFDFYLGAGPYYFEGKGKNAWGGKARLWGKYKDYVALEVAESYDNVFHNIVSGQIAFMLPIGCKAVIRKKNPCCTEPCFVQTISERMVQPVGREEIIVLDTKRKDRIAIDPATGLPSVFWFVNNLSHSAGTFESPFSTLAAAAAASRVNDVIYVFPGDGLGTGMTSGIVLKNNQRLLGSSIAHSLNTTLGAVTIPALSNVTPLLTNIGGAVVRVASNNEISGLAILHATGIGITGSNILNLTIADSVIQNSGSGVNTIELTNVSGALTLSRNLIDNNQVLGVLLTNTNINASQQLLENNFISSVGIAASIVYTNCSGNTVSLIGNEITSNTEGFKFTGATAIAIPNEFVIVDNLIKTQTFCLDIDSTNANFNATVFGNRLTGSNLTTTATAFFRAQGAARANVTLAKNQVRGGVATALNCTTLNTGFITATVVGNEIISGSMNGISFFPSASGGVNNTIAFSVTENKFSINNETNTNSLILTGNDPAGGPTGGLITGSIVGNQFNAGNSGVFLNNLNAISVARVSITSNDFSGCTTGVENSSSVTTGGIGTGRYSIVNNTFSDCNTAVALSSTNASSVSTCVNLEDNIAQPGNNISSTVGGYIFTRTTGTLNLEPTTGNIGQIVRSGTINNVPDGFCN
jgi:hypothetical protein